MSDFPFDTFRGIQNGDDATLDDVNVQMITFPDGSTQTQAATPSSKVTGIGYEGTTLTLTQSSGISDLTTTIPSGALPFSHTTSTAVEQYTLASRTSANDNDQKVVDKLETSITPTSTSQKVVLNLDMWGSFNRYQYTCFIRIQRTIQGQTPVLLTPPVWNNLTTRQQVNGTFVETGGLGQTSSNVASIMLVDEPQTTSQVTYVPIIYNTIDNLGTFIFTFNATNDITSDNQYKNNSQSTMTLECKL